MEEKKLLDACRRKSKKAQKELYEKYQNKMFRLCYRYLGNIHDTEDVLVEGFLKIFEKVDQVEYRNANSFVNWMKTIMINESLMLLRKKKRIQFTENDLIIEHENEIETIMELKEIMKLLASMPDGYRTIFNMYVIEGYSHNEISEALGINVQTSKSQLSRAKRFLQNLIMNLNYERRAV